MAFMHLQDMGLSGPQLEAFGRFQAMLQEGNARANLTAITEPAEVEIKHFVDSLLLRQSALWRDSFTDKRRTPKIADVGGGAGFPGIPLKICDDHMALDVLEASEKKVRFLRELADALELTGMRAMHIRAEEAGRDPAYRETYDWTLARGLAATPVLLEYCLPLLKNGGYLAAYKGPSGLAEARQGRQAAGLLGGKLVDVVTASLPEGMGERCILIYRKMAATPKKYPRPPGTPAKKPL